MVCQHYIFLDRTALFPAVCLAVVEGSGLVLWRDICLDVWLKFLPRGRFALNLQVAFYWLHK